MWHNFACKNIIQPYIITLYSYLKFCYAVLFYELLIEKRGFVSLYYLEVEK